MRIAPEFTPSQFNKTIAELLQDCKDMNEVVLWGPDEPSDASE